MAYAKGLPILVILENGIRGEGLLEKGYDWYVMTVDLTRNALATAEFNGVLSSWKTKVEQYDANKTKAIISSSLNPSELTVGQLVSNMKPSQLWAVLAAIVALMVGIFVIGQHFPAK